MTVGSTGICHNLRMIDKASSDQRWEGPTGAAYFLPENMPEDEKAAVVAAERERFGSYLAHAERRWQPIIEAIGVDGLYIDHTGGGVMTLKLPVPESSAEIWVGPFDADPEPSDELSVGIVFSDSDEGDDWDVAFADELTNESSVDELIEWIRKGIQSALQELSERR